MKITAVLFTTKAKGNYGANIIIDDVTKCQIVKKSDGSFKIYGQPSTSNLLDASEENEPIKRELVNAYLNIVEEDRLRKEEEKQREEAFYQRILDNIESERDLDYLSEVFDLRRVSVCSHWNDLYSGKTRTGLIISSKEDYDFIKRIINDKGFDIEEGELKHRAGEHHCTFSNFSDIEDYRKRIESHFSEKYNFITKETEEEFLLEKIKESDDIDDIRKMLNDFDNIQDGYYCGESFVHGTDFSDTWGYSYDVYTYYYAIVF